MYTVTVFLLLHVCVIKQPIYKTTLPMFWPHTTTFMCFGRLDGTGR